MTINYVEIISEFFPNIGVTCYTQECLYENLIWDSVVIPKADLDAKVISSIRDKRISLLSGQAGAEIVSGFVSHALGIPRLYDSSIEDQLNLLSAVSASQHEGSVNYPSRDPSTRVKSFDLHTPDQLLRVISDGSEAKTAILERLATLKSKIRSLTDQSEIESVTW